MSRVLVCGSRALSFRRPVAVRRVLTEALIEPQRQQRKVIGQSLDMYGSDKGSVRTVHLLGEGLSNGTEIYIYLMM